MSADKVYSEWNVNAFNRAWVFSLADRGCRLLPRKVLYTVADSLMDWYQGRSPATLADVADNVARAFPALPAAKVQAWHPALSGTTPGASWTISGRP